MIDIDYFNIYLLRNSPIIMDVCPIYYGCMSNMSLFGVIFNLYPTSNRVLDTLNLEAEASRRCCK